MMYRAIIQLAFILSLPIWIYGGQQFTLQTARAAAATGNAEAFYFLAKLYAKGDGVPQDYVQAAEYLKRAASLGLPFAQNDLGAYYAKGLGVRQDFAEAVSWYEKAARKGDSLAQYSLGRALWLGRGVATNVPAALKWLKKAAAQQQADALHLLGEMFLAGGPDLPRDSQRAFYWFSRAADAGQAGAFYSMGKLFETGDGLPADDSLAAHCYEQAAERRDAQAQLRLSELAMSAQNRRSDPIEACKWLTLAARNGEGEANHLLAMLRTTGRVSTDQLEQAVRRADAFEKTFSKK